MGFAAFFGVREEFFRAAFIQLNLVNRQNVYNTVACYIRSYFLHFTGFTQGKRLLIDLISGGVKLAAAPLERETVGSCYSLPIFSAPSPLRYEPHRHYPRAFCTLPSFARIERPRWRPVKPHGKIWDCEQSRRKVIWNSNQETLHGRGMDIVCPRKFNTFEKWPCTCKSQFVSWNKRVQPI